MATRGPVIGTIHASKGREGDNVFLYLPPIESGGDNEEEVRVVYVGATRARFQLYVGDAPGPQSGKIDGRVWKRLPKDRLLIEVGRAGDLDAEACRLGRVLERSRSQAQTLIASNRTVQGLSAAIKADLGWNMELVMPDKQRIAVLTDKVRLDLRAIAKSTKRWPQPATSVVFARSECERSQSADDPALDRLKSRAIKRVLACADAGRIWMVKVERTPMTRAISRDILIRRLREDLMGPRAPAETLAARPSDVYLTGILWPKNTAVSPDEDERLSVAVAGGDDDGGEVPELAQAQSVGMRRPSTAGVSFAVAVIGENRATAVVQLEFGVYHPADTGNKAQWTRQQNSVARLWSILPRPSLILLSNVTGSRPALKRQDRTVRRGTSFYDHARQRFSSR